jgi:hypothetical protein
MKPQLLDAYCGAGGAARGYQRAGFQVTGIDINPQPNYAGDTFVQGDAIEYIAKHGGYFDAIHASPPCQSSSALTKGTNKGRIYPDLIPQTRAALAEYGGPTVLENVQGSKVRRDLTLCGEYFGLGVIRHRYFEINGCDVWQPEHVRHRGRVAGWRHGVYYHGPYFAVYGDGGGKGTVDDWQGAMDIYWTNDRKELAEAIPPHYAEFIGAQLIEHIAERVA